MHHAKDNTTFAVAKDTFQGENECSTDMKQEANNIQGAEGSVIHSVDDFSGIITHQHFKIYKPAKVLTQFVFKHRKRKKTNSFGRYIGGNVSPKATIAIGRLDVDVEGLLLLTTDGKISEKVRRKSVEKEYWVQVDDQITEKAIERPQRGIEISLPSSEQHINSRGSTVYTTLPCKACRLETVMVETKNVVTTKEQSTCQDLTRNKKFKGPCNMCGKTGHKARDCSQNPIDVSKIKEGKETILRIISLPPGIPSSSRSTSRDKARKHGPTSWISLIINEEKNRQV